MIESDKHLINSTCSVKEALIRLNQLSLDAVLFIVDSNQRLLGSLTDGDVRRGLIRGLDMQSPLLNFANPNPKSILKDNYDIHKIVEYRQKRFDVIPVVDSEGRVINVINFRIQKSYLPIDAVIMAGGKGTRLRPLTDNKPKPMLPVGGKPILEYSVERLRYFGVHNIWITIHYLGAQIEQYFGDGKSHHMHIQYVKESEPLGTIGAVRLIDRFFHDYILVINSDLLTTVDYEAFFIDFLDKGADMAVVTIPYEVKVPYAVIETSNRHIVSFREKPTYTFYSNGGIYLLKREIIDLIPKNVPYNATDLMECLLRENGKLISFAHHDYWLDIGRPEDYEKANDDVKQFKFHCS